MESFFHIQSIIRTMHLTFHITSISRLIMAISKMEVVIGISEIPVIHLCYLGLLQVKSDFLETQECIIHAGPIRCFMLMVWPHKFKVGHQPNYHKTPHSPEKPENLNIPSAT